MTYSWGRRLIASALTAFVLAVVMHLANIVAFTLGYLGATTQPGWASFGQVNDFFALASVFAFVLLFVAGAIGAFRRWWSALVAGLVVGIVATVANSVILVATGGGGAFQDVLRYLLNSLAGFNLFYIVALAALSATFGRYLYTLFLDYRGRGTSRYALVRVPANNLADGLVTHIERSSIDSALADEQWDGYVTALVENGWHTVEVPVADGLADSVFVEDAAVIFGDLAVITNPGAEERKAETPAVESTLRAQGMRVTRIEEPGTLDGGDVLKVGRTVYVGRGGRTNAEGIRQLRSILSDRDYTVVAVPVTKALHLKSAVTALPDGTVIGHPDAVDDPSLFDRFMAVPEPTGAHVVVLDHDAVLMASSAPESAALIANLGYRVVTVDISEFEKLEGCVTCLSIRVR